MTSTDDVTTGSRIPHESNLSSSDDTILPLLPAFFLTPTIVALIVFLLLFILF